MHSIWLVLILSILSCSVTAGTLGDLKYEIADGQVAITDCKTLAEGELVIPNEIEGLPVTSIGELAFRNCIGLSSITIPDSVTSIEWGAFGSCSSLTSISIPEGVTSIGDGAFVECSSLSSIAIPESVTSLGVNAFNSCYSLTSITIPKGVTSIGDMTFAWCNSLTSISIPDSVTSIGNNAFLWCGSLTSITIPEGVTSIGEQVFRGCDSLTSITIPEAYHSQSEANRLLLAHLWPDSFFLNTSAPGSSDLSIRLAPVITVTGTFKKAVAIEVSETADGPWTDWQTVVIGEGGVTEIALDEGANKRFYRVRE